MNAGMYGMADGRGQRRKMIGRTTSGAPVENSSLSWSVIQQGVGASVNVITLAANTNTKVLSVSGKGALRWASATNNSGGGTQVFNFSVFIDGVRVYGTPAGGLGSNSSASVVMVGTCSSASTYVGPALDYWEFDSSLEIYVSASVGGSFYFINVVDLHQ